jgi:hypothetical protein
VKLTGKLKETYQPKFMENRNQLESQQISIQIKHPSHAERELLTNDIRYRQSENGTEITVRTKHKELIETCVLSITNLETETDGIITSGKELMRSRDPRLSELIDELVVFIKSSNQLTEEGEKN